DRSSGPREFRPITVTSSLTRLFHRILAIRADSLLNFDDSQRAFRSGIDGCRDNTMLLDAILRSRYERFKSASIATLDLAKAFDSVEHSAIMKCGAAAGLPPPMIRYLQRFYEDGTTTLTGDQWTSLPIRPTRGVKQGDPLSPVLFNIVIDHLLRSLPTECGIPFCGRTIRAMAFADDLILLAQTPAGLQKLLDHTASFLAECGLRVNSSKCHSLTIRGLGQAKKTVVDAQQHYCVNGQQIRALTSEDTLTYLGVVFSAQGRRKFDSASKISLLLERLAKAPLKPQQRLYALKCYALPRTYHAMSLGNTTISDLNRVDIMTRTFVRQWLALPNDTPTAYFHAPVAEGGLGIPSTRWMAPSLRLSRLRGWLSQPESGTANDITSGTSVDFSSVFVRREIAICEKRLTDGRTILQNTDIIGRRWARLLHSSIEGRALKDSCYTIGQHSWVSDGTALLSGKDYIACHRVRIGALPTRSRLTRGRHGDRQCRAGCRAQETNNHVLQICPRAHAARIKRHDAVANFISRSLTRQGFELRSEPRIPTSIGVRKPDLVATMGDLAVVLDVQIAGDQVDLDYVRHEKIRKYSTLPEVSRYITQETGATNIRHLPVILSWRGVWGRRSSLDLLALGTVNRRDLTIISTRTLIAPVASGSSSDSGGSKNREFRKTTSQKVIKQKPPPVGKPLLPVVVVNKAGKETEAQRERRLREARILASQQTGAVDPLAGSGEASCVVRSRSGSDKTEMSLTSLSDSESRMEYTEDSAKRTRTQSDESEQPHLPDDSVAKRIRPDDGDGGVGDEPLDGLAEIYSLDPKVQSVVSNNMKKKRLKEGMRQPDLREVDPTTEMSELINDLALYMARDDAKIAKFASAQVGIRVRKMQDIVSRLVVENAVLRTRLEEKEEVATRLWTVMKSGTGGGIGHGGRPDATAPEGGQVKDTRERASRKPTYAVVLQGSGEMDKGQLQNSLRELSSSVTAKVERVREMRGGKVMMELATEEDRQVLLHDQRLKDLGIKAQKERKFPPLVEVKGIDREMGDDRLLDEIWQRNLVDEVPAHEFEGKARVKMKIGRRDKDQCSVILEVSPRIRDVMLEKGRVFVGWEAHKVSIFERTLRCLKCYGFAHKAKDCKKQARCGNCGEEGHLRKDCTNGVGCAVCKEKGEKGEHSTWSETCPEARRRREKWRERTE
ncbi:unnamed protein product, partial [Trichogramma brassicae]